jgi:hypothetical protein
MVMFKDGSALGDSWAQSLTDQARCMVLDD